MKNTFLIKLFILPLLFIINPTETQCTEPTADFKNPESAYYDSHSKILFLSNIDGNGDEKDGKGYISKLDKDGKVIVTKWIKGLNAPKGMRSFKGHLFVTDIDRVIKINIKKKKIVKVYTILGSKFLNDIAIDSTDESLYISDTLTSTIYKIKNKKQTVFLKGDQLESPNGLLVHKGKLLVASWGLTKDWTTKKLGRLYSIDLKNLKIKYITKSSLGNLDGLEIDQKGNYLVSDWVKGVIYKISAKGKAKLIYRGVKGLADIAYIPSTQTLYAPLMLSNKLKKIKL